MFARIVEEKHRRIGMSRREFVDSASGMAAALFVINQVYGCGTTGETHALQGSGPGGGSVGGADGGVVGMDAAGYDVTPEMMEDQAAACVRLNGDEFVMDVQTHPPIPLSPWTPRSLPSTAEDYVKMLFVDSDTSVACLSGIPTARDGGNVNVEANRQLQELIERFAGPRMVFHANVDPMLGASELDYMAETASKYKLAAWKCYPHVGPWRLDQGVGLGFLQRARDLGIKLVAAHRGLGPGIDYAAATSPIDLANAAKAFPDITFLTYHSAWDPLANENHPFDPADQNPVGVDRLIKAVTDVGIGNDGNVYAELGSTWRNLMTMPVEAAHVFGKLLKHLGEDRIVWGTDCVFTGSAQEQIVALRAFQIPQSMQEQFGYPALTDQAKRKILGLNGARVYGIDVAATRCVIDADVLGQLKMAYRDDADSVSVPREKSYGPRTRREFLAFLRWERFGA
jgi:predicted TIM-barrel fold metal-dependent hydrolase